MSQKKRILIVDDEADLVAIINEQMTASGYDTVTAYSGEEGLKKLVAYAPDLVVLDVVMPGIDGFQLFKAVKKHPATSNIPVIMLTARDNMKDTFTSLDADGFITKPFKFAELLEKIDLLLSNRVLVLTDDEIMKEKFADIFSGTGYDPYFVATEDEMCAKMQEHKFKKVIIYLAMLRKRPEDLLALIPTFRYKNPAIMLYCDSRVEGVEDDYQVAIDAIRNQWGRAGIDNFYDPRVSQLPFNSVLRSWVSV